MQTFLKPFVHSSFLIFIISFQNKIVKATFYTHHLPFKHSFTISRGTKTHQPTFVVALEHLGRVGYGEAPANAYYNFTVEKLLEDAQRKKMFIEKFAFTEPERYWHYAHHLFPMNPFLVCALDMAGWDLYGKIKGIRLTDLWNKANAPQPITDMTIGIDSIEKMVSKLKETDLPVYKIKLGTENDIQIIQELRKHTDAPFRVDANAAWTVDEALRNIEAFKSCGVELVEQPLAADNWEGMEVLYKTSSIPIFADESCVKESDVEKCAPFFHGINIKLTKCSGITPALRMIEKARSLQLKIMLGSMNESSIGTAAIVHLSPLVDYLDADGPLLLAEDIATGLSFENGKVQLSTAPGLGVQLYNN